MFGLPLAFAAPFVLTALIALPALYYLLRVTPPPPRRVPLPTLPLVKDLVTEERLPLRTPWWLLALRLTLAGLGILALAGPRWNPAGEAALSGKGPLVLLIDNGWSSAGDWQKRRDRAIGLIDGASSRLIVIRPTAEPPQEFAPLPPQIAIERLRALQPAPHTAPREKPYAAVRDYVAATPGAEVIWIADPVDVAETSDAAQKAPARELISALSGKLTIVADAASEARAIVASENQNDALVARLVRPPASGKSGVGLVRGLDSRGRVVAEAPFDFAAGTDATASLTAPLQARNDIVRLEIAEARSAGAVFLLDANNQRRKVAMVTGETTDTAQPLVSGAFFVNKALAPYASVLELPRTGDAVAKAVEGRPEVIVLVDVGTLPKAAETALTAFVQEGGVLVRFSGAGLAAGGDALLPVKLRRGGRVLGGALSWEKPQRIASFSETGPFYGLTVPTDVLIDRQVLAEPEPELTARTWAALTDGTPLVTARKLGKGSIVLFHVTADTSWSNLPLSGAFVDMFRRVLAMTVSASDRADAGPETASPRRTLNGFGEFVSPPPQARGVARNFAGAASLEHPPGFYGPPEAALALNTLAPQAKLTMLDLAGAPQIALDATPPIDLRRWLLAACFGLLLADCLAVLALAGLFRRGGFRNAAAALALVLLGAMAAPGDALAQQGAAPVTRPAAPRKEDIEASLNMRLAYILTGNKELDETSRLGLAALSRVIGARTSFEPAAPIGLDPAKDELVFYALIYWPISPEQPMPGEAALRAIDQFMKNGGTVIFDTRDANSIRTTTNPPPETRRLRQMLASLDIPEIEQIPKDHVLTKTFYLLDKVIGRYAAGETWVESLPRGASDEKRPARAGDRVSPLIITSNDLAAAWAVDRDGAPRFPMAPGEPRQREMALRSGVNIVMYAMTGNYKADQVHIPALLERLGQ